MKNLRYYYRGVKRRRRLSIKCIFFRKFYGDNKKVMIVPYYMRYLKRELRYKWKYGV